MTPFKFSLTEIIAITYWYDKLVFGLRVVQFISLIRRFVV